MVRPRLALLGVSFFLAGLLLGCGGGSSSPPPTSPLAITTQSPLSPVVVNSSYSTTFTATGGLMPYAWSASGNVPPGLSLSRAGVLSGTPTTAGTFMFTVSLLDSEQPASIASTVFSITISPTLQITTTSLPNGSSGVYYSDTLAATGGVPPYTWMITQGSLPGGLTLNATSGVISGTPSGTGTSSFGVEATDSESPALATSVNLSIVINPPPPRSAALYTALGDTIFFSANQLGLQIQSDGSLTPLASSPETAITGNYFAASPTLPLLFMFVPTSATVQALLVNQDYSLAAYGSSAPLPNGADYLLQPSVDPTGSNLYLPGYINSSLTQGVTIFPGDGSLQPSGTIAISDAAHFFSARMVFTPDSTLAFFPTCSESGQGSILSFTRSTSGMLTPAAAYSASSCKVAGALAVSPDGKYLATPEVQIYSIAGDGTLTPVLPQPLRVFLSNGTIASVNDLAWETDAFLLAATESNDGYFGGVAVLSFSGSALTETVFPNGLAPIGRLQVIGSFVYAMELCSGRCTLTAIRGYDFQNGQLTAVPGSPFPYGNAADMVVY